MRSGALEPASIYTVNILALSRSCLRLLALVSALLHTLSAVLYELTNWLKSALKLLTDTSCQILHPHSILINLDRADWAATLPPSLGK